MRSIETMVADARKTINKRIADKQSTKEALDRLYKILDFSMEEYVKFQELKSLAVFDKTITLEDGMYIYNILGEAGPEAFNKSEMAVKVMFTELFTMWMRNRITSMSS